MVPITANLLPPEFAAPLGSKIFPIISEATMEINQRHLQYWETPSDRRGSPIVMFKVNGTSGSGE
jgi:hypothetical protein